MKITQLLWSIMITGLLFAACSGSDKSDNADTEEQDLKTRVQSDPLFEKQQEVYIQYLEFLKNNPEVTQKINEMGAEVQETLTPSATEEDIRNAWQDVGFPEGAEQNILASRYANLTLEIREKYPELNDLERKDYDQIMIADALEYVNSQNK